MLRTQPWLGIEATLCDTLPLIKSMTVEKLPSFPRLPSTKVQAKHQSGSALATGNP